MYDRQPDMNINIIKINPYFTIRGLSLNQSQYTNKNNPVPIVQGIHKIAPNTVSLILFIDIGVSKLKLTYA